MIVITDANIFMHLIDAELVGRFFQLEQAVITTQEVFEEIGDELDQLIPFLDQLEIILSSEEEIAEIQQMNLAPGLSFADRTIVFHANRNKYVVLTGERLMRSECEMHGLEVHGILWIMDRLVERELIAGCLLADKLEALLLQPDFRVPKMLCQERIKNWRGV